MKNKIEESLKYAQSDLKFSEKSLKTKLDEIANDLERMLRDAKLYINDDRYTLEDKTNQIIHLIHWGIANMHIDNLTDRTGRHQAVKKQIEVLTELLQSIEN